MTSSTGYSSLISSVTEKPQRPVYTSFPTPNQLEENLLRPGFGQKQIRFDGQLDINEYYNKKPGPGTYQENALTVENTAYFEAQKLKK
jgi:hypothetical protein